MPYNSPMKKKGSSCMQMKDYKGKPSGLMMEGSAAYMSMLHNNEGKSKEGKLPESAPARSASNYDASGPTGGFGPTEPTAQEVKNKKRKDLYKSMDSPNSKPENAKEYKSPATMSPLNNDHDKNIDPKTGKKITYRLKGTSDMYDDEGFLKPEFAMDEGGAGEAGADRFFDRQRRADEALNIAQNLLTGGASANLGHISTDYPYAAGHIVGKTYDDRGYIDTSVGPTQANIDRLREINRSDPERAFNEIAARTRNVMLGDAADDWKMEVDPLNQYERRRSGWRNKKRKTLGAPGQTLYEKTRG